MRFVSNQSTGGTYYPDGPRLADRYEGVPSGGADRFAEALSSAEVTTHRHRVATGKGGVRPQAAA